MFAGAAKMFSVFLPENLGGLAKLLSRTPGTEVRTPPSITLAFSRRDTCPASGSTPATETNRSPISVIVYPPEFAPVRNDCAHIMRSPRSPSKRSELATRVWAVGIPGPMVPLVGKTGLDRVSSVPLSSTKLTSTRIRLPSSIVCSRWVRFVAPAISVSSAPSTRTHW